MKVLLKRTTILIMGFFMLLSTQICSATVIELTGDSLDTFVVKYNAYIDTMRQRNNNAVKCAKISQITVEPDSKVARYASVFDRATDYVLIFELNNGGHPKEINCWHAVNAADESVEVAFRACCAAIGITDENNAYASMKRAENNKERGGITGEIYTDPMTGRQYRFTHPSIAWMPPVHNYAHWWKIVPIVQLTPEEQEQRRALMQRLVTPLPSKK